MMYAAGLRAGLVALGAVLVAAAAGPVAAQGVIRWDLANEYAATSLPGEADTVFGKLMKEKSAGKIEVVHHFAGALGVKSPQHFESVSNGAVPIASTPTNQMRGVAPVFSTDALPFLAVTIEEARILRELTRPLYEQAFAKNNQIMLYAVPWPPSGIWAKRPITKAAEIKGLKIRTYDPNGTTTLKTAGAAAIQLAWSDIMPQVASGSIEAVLTSAEGGASSKFWDLLSHFTEINYAVPLSVAHMNLDAYNKLTPELKQAVLEAGKAAEEQAWKNAIDRVEQNYRDMKQHNMTVITKVDPDLLQLLQKSADAAYDDYKKRMGGEGDRILAAFRERVKR